MINIILNGCCGKMGSAVIAAVENKQNMQIIGGVDIRTDVVRDFPVAASFEALGSCRGDVVIDFSNPAAFEPMIEFCKAEKIPAVVCTTGLSDKQICTLKESSKVIPVFFSANMSLGVNLLVELSKTAAKVLGDSFDIEIIEQHHNQKIDAPSGTALAIADAVNSAMACNQKKYVYDRHSSRQKRTRDEIGIHSIRGGTITGEHTILFAGNDEMIEIKHTAVSKDLFAEGALKAATFLYNKAAGYYEMSDIFEE